jgi:general secretion pathway protein G
MKKSFTMLELIFVIIVIGILSAVAIPKIFATRDDAMIVKLKTDVSNIRGAIANLRTKKLMQGDSSYPSYLDDADADAENEELFDGNSSIGVLLDYPIYSKEADGHWMKRGDNDYTARVLGQDINFRYYPSNGHFDCKGLNTAEANETCMKLTH